MQPPDCILTRLSIRATKWLLIALGAWVFLPAQASAAPFFRARFEPTTLELEEPGQLEFDAQFGGVYGNGPDGDRLVIPDFELDLGLTSWLELDVDGAFLVTKVSDPERRAVGEPLWTAAKFALLNVEDEHSGNSYGVGLQVGPRLPSLRTPHDVGFAGLVLLGAGTRQLHVVANLGTVLDRSQPRLFVYGIDLEFDFGEGNPWSLLGEVGGAHAFGPFEREQLLTLLGFGYQANKTWQLSLSALTGLLPHNDRFGMLAGVASLFDLW